jgi:hypothetical protein
MPGPALVTDGLPFRPGHFALALPAPSRPHPWSIARHSPGLAAACRVALPPASGFGGSPPPNAAGAANLGVHRITPVDSRERP